MHTGTIDDLAQCALNMCIPVTFAAPISRYDFSACLCCAAIQRQPKLVQKE